MSAVVIITGGMGFIGGHLTLKLLSMGYSVYVVDNLITASFSPTDTRFSKNKNFNFYHFDLTEANATNLRHFEKLVRESDYFFHFASPVGVVHIDHDPNQAITNLNIINQNVLQLLVKYKIKTFFASSSEVYGNCINATENDDLVIGNPGQLRWGYACGKLMMEFLLRSYQIPHLSMRFFNVTGAGQSSLHGMVLPRFIRSAVNNENIEIYGSGNQLRAFCDVEDAVNFIVVLLERDIFDSEIFNVGNDANAVTINDLARLVISVTNSSSTLSYLNFSKVFSAECADILKRTPNISKMRCLYVPKISIVDCIKKTLLDYQ